MVETHRTLERKEFSQPVRCQTVSDLRFDPETGLPVSSTQGMKVDKAVHLARRS